MALLIAQNGVPPSAVRGGEGMNKKQKAVKDILQVLAENEFTAWECLMVLERVRELFGERPLCKTYVNEIEGTESFKTFA